MLYRIVGKDRLIIFEYLSIPVPYSEPMKKEDAQQMLLRWSSVKWSILKECEIMGEDRFRALSGLCPIAK